MTETLALARRSLHDEIAERLRQMILDGRLAPGAKVPERELCERFAVSRTPMREALKVLAAEGHVTLTPNRGARVSVVTLEDLDDLFPVMGALEALAGELAAQRMSDAEIAKVAKLHARLERHFETGDLAGYFKVNEAIHEAILAGARSKTLVESTRALSARVRRARYLANMTPARWTRAMEEHRALLAALEARDGDGLSAILKQHLAQKLETVRAWLEETA